MLRVGLTGGIGAGKSEVSRRLASYGAVVIDADAVAREVVAPGTPGLAEVVQAFGPEVLRSDGTLDRDRLGELVFADESLRMKLNAITHPRVGERMAELERQAGGAPVIVHDVPLLAENHLAGSFDEVVVVDVPGASRRSGWPASAACPGTRRRPGWERKPPGRNGSRSPPSWWTTPAPSPSSTGRSASCGRNCGAGPGPPRADPGCRTPVLQWMSRRPGRGPPPRVLLTAVCGSQRSAGKEWCRASG